MPSSLMAQEKTLVLGLELRPRLLINDGYKNPLAEDAPVIGTITQRSRLWARYRQSFFETYLSFQDIRLWGDENLYSSSGTYGTTGSAMLFQGWFILKPWKTFSIKTGRQLFSYDDQRILSARNWNDYQVTYDAVLVQFDDGKNKVDVGLTWNMASGQNMLYPDIKFRVFDFVRYERFFGNLSLSGIALITGNTMSDTVAKVYLRGTYGLNVVFQPNRCYGRFSGYYQHNLNNNGTRLRAYALSFFSRYEVVANALSVGAWYDLLSGVDQTKTGATYLKTDHWFDIFYGRRHGWYGYQDMFPPSPAEGLQDLCLNVGVDPWKKLHIQLDGHFFWMQGKRYNDDGSGQVLQKNLGQELDLTVTWKILDFVVLQGGYSCYFMTRSFKQVKNVSITDTRFPQYGYVMVTVTPQFTLWEKGKGTSNP